MQAESFESPAGSDENPIDWEAFYANYRKPGYIPGYEIVNKLGGGMFGMVFKARKESIGKDYAIKFLKVDEESTREAIRREVGSVEFFAQIDHPNLVSIEDRGEIDGIPFIIMSYAGEQTLQKRLESGAMGRDDALKIFIQAARGVQALHEHSLVHFDLKPANIFLRGDIARVGDYGLSKLVTQSRNSLSFGRGTPYYMAPEMLQRRGDHRSDIYSLGIILYECLVGEVPFKGDSEWEVLRKHETEQPHFPPHIGATERQVILRAMAKQPEARYESVADLLHALQAPASLGESMVIPPRRTVAQPAPAADPSSQSSPPPIPPQGPPPRRRAQTAPFPTPNAPNDVGPIGAVVHVVFRLFEFVIMIALVPLRAIATGLGRLLVFLVQVPFRLVGIAAKAIGVLFVIGMLTLVVISALAIIGHPI